MQKSSKDTNIILPIFFLAIALVLRIVWLTSHDVWFDEAASYFISRLSLSQLVQATGADTHPPLYYLFLHFWILIVNNNQILLRLPSLLFNLASIYIFFKFLRSQTSRFVSFWTTIYYALSPALAYYSGEIRMYTLFNLGVVSSLYLWHRIYDKFLYRILFSVIFAFTCLTHYYGYLLIFPLFLDVFFRRNRQRHRYLIPIFVSILMTIPWLYYANLFTHPAPTSVTNIVGIPATFVSWIIGGLGQISLRQFFGISLPITLLLLLASMIILGQWLYGVIKFRYRFDIQKNLIFLCFPLIFVSLLNVFIPVYSVRALNILLAPFFYQLLGLTLQTKPTLKPVLISILMAAILLVHIILYKYLTPQFHKLTKLSGQTTLHMSVLSFYPFEFYKNNEINILLTPNPLSSETIKNIGGKQESIPKLEQVNLVLIQDGADNTIQKRIFTHLEELYETKTQMQKNAITLFQLTSKR